MSNITAAEYNDAVLQARKTLHRPSVHASMRSRLESLLQEGQEFVDLDQPPDMYGDGVVQQVENTIADMLGKPSAVFFPTGTMAQQVTLRVWAERTGSNVVALHALSHPEVFESGAFPLVSRLETRPIAFGPELISRSHVENLKDDVGAVMFELPLRDAGYLLPTWDDLVSATESARRAGKIVHFDAARLFECVPHLGRDVAAIAALADTLYVSCYKSIDGMSGAFVVGPQDVMDEARVWRHRYGGRVYQQFPSAISTLIGIQKQVPGIAACVQLAARVAAELAEGLRAGGMEWFRVQPEKPHTQQFQVWLPRPASQLVRCSLHHMQRSSRALFMLPWWEPGMPPGLSLTEVTVGSAAAQWEVGEVRHEAQEFATMLRADE